MRGSALDKQEPSLDVVALQLDAALRILALCKVIQLSLSPFIVQLPNLTAKLESLVSLICSGIVSHSLL